MSHQLDHSRRERIGQPEAILCEGKDPATLAAICRELTARQAPCLFTRMTSEQHRALSEVAELDYHRLSRTAFLHGSLPRVPGRVNVVTAGSCDLAVASEAARTLEFHGVAAQLTVDVGVAGLFRLLDALPKLRECDVLIAVAGMDAALVSVLGGLVGMPVIGVPTSVGYGVAEAGRAALHAMLASCAQGVTVVNIDNGFGAACAALRMLGTSNASVLGDAAHSC